MLKNIHINNFALIEDLNIDFHEGFSVITGETGAGKSIILEAINILLGQRADNRILKGKKCIIEMTFDISGYDIKSFFDNNELEYDEECIIRREISATGKSRSFINDTPVSLQLTKELGNDLIDIHSQYNNLQLGNERFQIDTLDAIAGNKAAMERYRTVFEEYGKLNRLLDEKIAAHTQSREYEDYTRFRLNELKEANFKEDEQETLEEEQNILIHAEEIKESLFRINVIFNDDENGTLNHTKEQLNRLESVSKKMPQTESLARRMENLYIELKDIYMETSAMEENITFDQDRLNEINDRLNTIYSFQQKYHKDSVAELIGLRDELQSKLDEIDSFEDDIEELKKQIEDRHKILAGYCKELTRSRTEAAVKIEKAITSSLIQLGMPNVKFHIEISQKKDFSEDGSDHVTVLFSANKNQPLRDIGNTASGGEIARVMLSLKSLIADYKQLPTIIFDEIDTGVSGEIAAKMGDIMKQMGKQMQIISITHLPQIASKGKYHYKVYKQDNEEQTTSHIKLLPEEERITEIAHMLSGETITKAAVDNAKELLKS